MADPQDLSTLHMEVTSRVRPLQQKRPIVEQAFSVPSRMSSSVALGRRRRVVTSTRAAKVTTLPTRRLWRIMLFKVPVKVCATRGVDWRGFATITVSASNTAATASLHCRRLGRCSCPACVPLPHIVIAYVSAGQTSRRAGPEPTSRFPRVDARDADDLRHSCLRWGLGSHECNAAGPISGECSNLPVRSES